MLRFQAYTNDGGRPKNEDNFGIAYYQDGSVCFVVADGLGGHGGGEVASRIAVDQVCELFVEDGWSEHFFRDAFYQAQKEILEEQCRQHAPSRMKTTLVVLVVHDGVAEWAHVGDSRLYYFKKGRLKKRTIDHSVPQMLALSGEIKESEIRHHPDRNRLMRVLGIRGEEPRFEAEKPMKLAGKQSFLLCTDGFWELIEEKQMEEKYLTSSGIDGWIDHMTEIVFKNGEGTAMDNLTCVVVDLENKGSLWG